MSNKKLSEELQRRLEDAAVRQLEGLKTTTKLARDSLYSNSYEEAKKWLDHAQLNVVEAKEILSELMGKKS